MNIDDIGTTRNKCLSPMRISWRGFSCRSIFVSGIPAHVWRAFRVAFALILYDDDASPQRPRRYTLRVIFHAPSSLQAGASVGWQGEPPSCNISASDSRFRITGDFAAA